MTDSAQATVPASRSNPRASWAFVEGDEIAPGRRAVRKLGGGALFEAYLARDAQRLTFVVCKLARPDQVADQGTLRLLRREAGLLARLAHPAIVRTLGATLDGPRPHLLLEHVNKISLRRRLRRRGPLPLDRVLRLALHLGAALHYLAAEGVVHLDVKPGNILLGATPRLIDFSLARSSERASRIQRPSGTAAYMAPEQCLPGERGAIGPATDVWGLGMTLHEAITGQLAFGPGSREAASGTFPRHPQLAGSPAKLPAGVPAELAATIMRCLSADPAARPAAGAVVAALQPLAESPALPPDKASG